MRATFNADQLLWCVNVCWELAFTSERLLAERTFTGPTLFGIGALLLTTSGQRIFSAAVFSCSCRLLWR